MAFLTEAADDYEHALREIDRMRGDLARMEALLGEHRDREANLRNTMLTAQRSADEIKESAQNESKLIVREAQGRADLLFRRRRVASRKSIATSTSSACADATSKARSKPRSSRSIAHWSSSAIRIRIAPTTKSCSIVRGRPTLPRLAREPPTPSRMSAKQGADQGPVAIDATGAVLVTVRVIPRARETRVDGVRNNAVLVRLAAPPVDGAANVALLEFLSACSSVRAASCASSPVKLPQQIASMLTAFPLARSSTRRLFAATPDVRPC